MHDIIFFQANGRSGTQWFAQHLQNTFSDLAQVTHEPIHYAYNPKKYFRRYDSRSQKELLAQPEVKEHVARIEQISNHQLYVEIGFPSYAAIPALYEKFGNRLKLIHLVRHPVFNAASQVTHGWYDQTSRPDMAEAILPTPENDVDQWYYYEKWHTLTQFEKCLFFWSEFHLHALELHQRFPAMEYLRVRFEDVFESTRATDTLERLVAFMGLPWRESLVGSLQQREDQWPHKIGRLDDWQDVYNHPQTLALSLKFGYDLGLMTDADLKDRYLETWSLFQKVRRRVQKQRGRRPRTVLGTRSSSELVPERGIEPRTY